MPSVPNPDIDLFNRWAAVYDRLWWQRSFFGPAHALMIAQISAEVPGFTPQSILDVGCGTGRLLRSVARRWPRARLLGVDAAEKMVEQAKCLTPGAELQWAPAESLPIPDESVDLVLSSFSLHHWADPQRGIEEIVRVLRPGGRFCLADFTLPRWLSRERTRPLANLQALVREGGLALTRHRRFWWRVAAIMLARRGARSVTNLEASTCCPAYTTSIHC